MLAYGVAGDLVDEYMCMSESTCIESMYNFCQAITAVFGAEYLRDPNLEDTQRLLSINERRGFPGMLGSILYVLGVEELPFCMAGAVFKSCRWLHCYTRGRC
jgi:hypothetical protein